MLCLAGDYFPTVTPLQPDHEHLLLIEKAFANQSKKDMPINSSRLANKVYLNLNSHAIVAVVSQEYGAHWGSYPLGSRMICFSAVNKKLS